MGYKILRDRDTRYTERPGLEGPFFYPNGQVLYYDSKEGMYYDPTTDFYVEYEQVEELKNMFLQALTK